MRGQDVGFLEFCVKQGALKFGSFTLKSGRVSPYFFNAGAFSSGFASYMLSKFFARKIADTLKSEEYGIVFGPAYKGIPLAVGTCMALHEGHKIEKEWCFNRKEAKEHGDAGIFVGAKIKDKAKIVLLDDVFTTGGAKEEAIVQLSSVANVKIAGVFIMLDREEKNEKGENAIAAFEKKHNTKVHSLASACGMFEALCGREIGGSVHVTDEIYAQFLKYKKEYGV